MSKHSVCTEGKGICTDASDDWAVTEADAVRIKKVEAVFPNQVCSSELKNGTTITSIGDASIWTDPAQLGEPSLPIHPSDAVGVVSGKPASGEAQVQRCSTMVFAEGDGVVRVDDPTFQNRRNAFGVVCPDPLDLSGGGGGGGGGAAGDGDGGGAGRGGSADETGEGTGDGM